MKLLKPLTKLGLAGCLLAASGLAQSLEFRSVTRSDAIWYEAPADNSKKLFVVSRGMPLEILSEQGNWLRVRDSSGTLAWMKANDLGQQRMVQLVRNSTVFAAPQDKASILFKGEKNLLLELQENTRNGWLKVRHRDGATGFIRIEDVWGV
ncbi:SH3 domain-containing protein [Chitinilyticum piscinae]|uniref:SH3 domain-containing protein n=1 Tax=Chitinilyticum piscinae TaxID=2866724 RepID=A0A8J7K2V0_9NEIS|nr:SH3 domain-containing protein [Chitinilyticum piscinae]MBE9611021.1 SH3 domain-containing protein [Chitinilyticum piscinae]